MIYSIDYKELMSQINALAAVRYLESMGWKIFPRRNQSIRIMHKTVVDKRSQILIPIEKTLSDYNEAMYRAIQEISRVQGISLNHMVLLLLNPNTDILKIRLARKDVEPGNILFDDAINLYENAKKLLGAAAMDVLNPKIYHKGRSETTVRSFLEKCRFGQTEIGSYIVSIVCPLADVSDGDKYQQLNIFSSEEELTQSFTRRVTTKVMENLQQIKTKIDSDALEDLQSVKKTKISANFYEALNGLVNVKDAQLEFQASWSPRVKPAKTISDNVVMSSDYSQPIEAVITTLKRKREVQSRIIGRIEKMESTANLDRRTSGWITVVYLNPDNKRRKITVSLDKADYAEAVQAHFAGKFVEIKGTIDQKTKKASMKCETFNVIE